MSAGRRTPGADPPVAGGQPAAAAAALAGEAPHPAGADGLLAQLLEVERSIEAEVEAAEVEAARIVASARHDVDTSAEAEDGPLEVALGALRETIQRECEASVRALQDRAETEAARYRQVQDATLAELAHWIAARVAGTLSAS